MSFGLGFSLPNWQTLSGGAFNPLSLFQGGVQGAFYDPSDPTVLFSDRAGTTPVGTPGGGSVVPVGLMLDKSQGLVLGSELVTPAANRDFSSNTGYWTPQDGSITIAGGAANFSSTTNDFALYAAVGAISASLGRYYEITYTLVSCSAGAIRFGIGANYTTSRSTPGTYTERITAGAGGFFGVYAVGTTTASVDNVSIKQVTGNHAIAANDTTARPELRARVNLLTYSEDFSNAAWATAGTGSAPTKGTVSTDRPDGTSGTVSTLTFPGVSGPGNFTIAFQSTGAPYLNVPLTFTIWMRVASGTGTIYLNVEDNAVSPSGGNFFASPALALTTTWQRFTLSGTRTSATGNTAVMIGFDGRAAAGQTNAGTLTVQVWGAQLTATNEFPANTYQRIVDANTYDAVGFPRYLVANGTSSAMSTPGNVNLSGTDKVTVFAGVRKLSDAAIQLIAELSAVVDTTNGAMAIGTSIGAAQRWFSALRGTQLAYYEPATYAAPISNVLTTTFDIAGSAISSEIVPRVNGLVEQDNPFGANAGTGNFGSHSLFIGARNNTLAFLNGNIYSIIVVGSAVSAGQISATEQWVAGKVGITI